MDGYINLLKPPGMTSSDAVVRVRRLLPRGERVGHGGTLDPDASGVLPILVGRAARLFDYLIDKKKVYLAELMLGVRTDTQDSLGVVTRVMPVTAGEAEVRAAIPRFVGEIDQVPPAFSAIQRDGKRMYELARAGREVELLPRRVRVEAIDYVDSPARGVHRLRVACGKGVYIRTLIDDLGEAVGDGAHMTFLLREAAGWFGVADALAIEELEAMAAEGRLCDALTPMDAPLGHMPLIRYRESLLRAAKNGLPLPSTEALPEGEPIRVYVGDRFAGVGERKGAEVRFKVMLLGDAT